LDGTKILLLVIIAVLSFVLMLASYGVCNHYSLRTPGALVADHFAVQLTPGPGAPQGWWRGKGIFVEIGVDFAAWFGILSALCWIIGKLRS
jgi:hypothetical protein